MIACPKCGGTTSVTETRTAGTNVRRRRRCGCGHRVTTVEVIVGDEPAKRSRSTVDLVAVARPEIEAIRDAAARALGAATALPQEGATKS